MAQSLFLEKDSPVDFLYLDRQRLASLIGQLSDRGQLIGLKSVFQKSQTKEAQASGNAVAVKIEGKASGSSSESSEEIYDPFWSHAYSFLRDLEENFAVPVENARMGSLVKLDALVQFIDLKIMRNLWEPILRTFLHSQTSDLSKPAPATSGRKHRREKQQRSEAHMPDTMKFGLEVMKEIPHLLNMTFLAPSGLRFWAAAQPDYLTISSDALIMKFGAVIDGLWTVVGIVDGNIGEPSEPVKISPMLDAVVAAMAGIRESVGRPKDHFGFTPIAIYAPLSGSAEAEVESHALSSDTASTDEPTE